MSSNAHRSDVRRELDHRLNRLQSGADRASQSLEVQQAIAIARVLCQRARELQTPQERRQQAELDRMIQSPHDKATLMQLTDQAFRSRRPPRAADQLIHILDVQGVPRFFNPLERTLLLGFQSFGAYLPGVAMPFVKERMQHETANVILPAERELLAEHLRARWEEGVRMNVNYLGEGALGEEDARRRLQGYLAALQQAEIEVISVKISTIYSQISPLRASTRLACYATDWSCCFARRLRPRSSGRTAQRCPSLSISIWRSIATRRSRPRPSCARSTAPGWNRLAPALR